MSPENVLRRILYIVVVAKFTDALRIDNTLVTAKNGKFNWFSLLLNCISRLKFIIPIFNT